MSEELRIRAMDFAIAARTSQHEDIVELAQRIYAFLNEDDVPLKDALAYAGDIVSNMPPPIPQQDLGKADQSPKPYGTMGFVSGGVPMPFGTVVIGSDGQIQRYEPDPSRNPFDASDTPTRIVRPVA